MVIKNIDVNCDLGEQSDARSIDRIKKVLPFISSGNVACGFHAGTPKLIRETIDMLVARNVQIGAHPSFNDRENFGREENPVSPDVIYDELIYQISAISGIAKVAGGVLKHVKPHGALYNMAACRRYIAEAVVNAVLDVDKNLVLYGLAGSLLIKVGSEKGLTCAEEFFVDRAYQSDGTLTPRNHPAALIDDVEQSIDQMIKMVRLGIVEATNGDTVKLRADTICLHGDNVFAPQLAKGINESLIRLGVEIGPVR